ncbi:MAG: type II secretion system F family protein [Desulfurococcales archaeon]|nr:type II secretion system F family protein [Desulfurococcales archaeon]
MRRKRGRKVKLALRRKSKKSKSRKGRRMGFLSIIDIISVAVFGGIALKIVEGLQLDRKAIEGNMRVHPVYLIAKYFYYTFIAGVYAVFAIIYLYPVIPSPFNLITAVSIFLIIGMLPLVPVVKIYNAVEENKSNISRELPYFMFHMAVLARTRLSLEDFLNRMSISTVYPTVASYMKRITAMSKTLGFDLLHAIEEVGLSIPHKALSSTLTGFANVLRTRGNVTDFLERAMDLTMEDQRKYLEQLKGSVSMMAMMYSVVMISILFLNILQVTSATGKLALSLPMYALTSIVLIPMLSFAIFWMIYLKVPRMETPSRYPLYMFIAWLPIGLIIGYMLADVLNGFTIFYKEVGLSIGLAIPSFAASRAYSKQNKGEETLMRKFTDFLHNIASERRLGVPLEQILLNMEPIYGPLNSSLRILKMGIRTGMPMRLSIALAFSQIRSKVVRFMAVLLSDAIVLGSATEETFNFMERMVRELIEVIDSMRSELRSISLTPYVIIIVEVVGIAFFITTNPVAVVNTGIQGGGAGGLFGSQPTYNAANLATVSHYFAYGTILTSFVGAFIIGLLRRQNVWAGFFHAGVILTIIAITLALTNKIGIYHPV